MLFRLFARPEEYAFTKKLSMLRALGVILVLWYLSHTFTQSFIAFDRLLTATFESLEAAAIASQKHIE